MTGTLEDTLAQCGTFVGTAKYMAPEQLAGKAYSYAADVWALGICLVEFGTGTHPCVAVHGDAIRNISRKWIRIHMPLHAGAMSPHPIARAGPNNGLR